MCRCPAAAAVLCVLVIVAGLAELLFAASKLHSIWLPHVALNITGGLLSVVCGFGHLVALRLSHGRCETCGLRSFLVTASLIQLVGLLFIIADRVGSVGYAIHQLGLKSIIVEHEAMKIFGKAQNDTDVRVLLVLNIVCTLLTWMQCASVCRPSTSFKPLNPPNVDPRVPNAWVYSLGPGANDSTPILDSSQNSSPGRNVSIIRTESVPARNVTLMSYKPLFSYESPDGRLVEFVPLKDLKSQAIEEYSSQYSLARAAKEPMQSFMTNLSQNSERKSLVKLLETSISPRPSISLPPLILKSKKFSVVGENRVTSDEIFSHFLRYQGLPDRHSEALSPVATSAGGTDSSSGSYWDDDSWATMSVSARQGSLVSVAVDGVGEETAKGNAAVAVKMIENFNLLPCIRTTSTS